MKSFRPINIVPIQVNTFGENADTPEVVALKQQFNDKLREVAEKTNEALESLTGGLLDSGLWANGEILTLTSNDFSDKDTDFGFRHHLGTVPQRALQFIPDGALVASGGGYGYWPMVRRGAARWTDTYIYLRASEDIVGAGDSVKLEILLIP